MDNYPVRQFSPETDIQPLLRLSAAVEQADQIGQDISESALRTEFEWYGHDPELDRWVIESPSDPGLFLAHAWTFTQTAKRSILHVAVHPEFRKKGFGTVLLDQAIARASNLGAEQVVSVIQSDRSDAALFLKDRGFVPAGINRFMAAPGDLPLPRVLWPLGFGVQTLADFQDIALYVEALNACYSDMWGHAQNTVATTVESFTKVMERYPDYFDPEAMWVVFDGDARVCGVCSARAETAGAKQTSKTIDSPGIAPVYRALPLLQPLTLTAMGWLDSQAKGLISLETWGDSEAAESTYRNLGFTFVPGGHETEYVRLLIR